MHSFSSYAWIFVIYDKTSQVTVQDDNPLYCMSASESNGYKWQANINNDDDKTRFDISWKQTTKIYNVDDFK
jgi:hypothetical protein